MTHNIQDILSTLGIAVPNEMQQAMLDKYTKRDDIILLSPTGTGKTLAYLLPLTNAVNPNADSADTVIIVPSRELALQIDQVVRAMKCGLRSVSLYGGRPVASECATMDGVRPHIIISTPGRLCDHMHQRNIDLSKVRRVVIDEFDKCLELGFHDDMQEAIERMTRLEQRILVSATRAESIPEFVPSDTGRCIELDFLSTNNPLSGRILLQKIQTDQMRQTSVLRSLMRSLKGERSIVFCNQRDTAEDVYRTLHGDGFECELFHGQLTQDQREKSLCKFENGSSNILISTDLGARGLDIDDIGTIIHYDIPLSEKPFIHRNGRTARWTSQGRSIALICSDLPTPPYLANHTMEELTLTANISQRIVPTPWVTLYIGKGKKDKLSKMDIMGFLCKIGGAERNDIGRIDVKAQSSFVAVKRGIANSLLKNVRGQKIKGIKTIIDIAR